MTHPSLYLGIDTGGTFTDGVLIDAHTRAVLKTVKAITTHHDLKIGIAEALSQLIPPDPSQVTLISLSTTLATNAIAEGKRKIPALFLLGYDPTLVQTYNFHEQFGTPHQLFITGRHDLRGIEQEPLDEAELHRRALALKDQVDAFAIASYAGPMNASHELRASQILTDLAGLPVVQAHHLSSELDSIRRATTASLNASLLSNVQEFLDAVEKIAAQYGLHCPVMLIKGDGSMVQASWARQRPVEIIHSGPATSTVGGHFLSGLDTALVVDIGGTTTDIALVDRGKLQILDKAATVGQFRTCVQTIKTRSFGLGGDSRIGFDRWDMLTVGPERVAPLSFLCHHYPQARQELESWLWQKHQITYPEQLEFWMLRREPTRLLKGERARLVIEKLRQGPRLMLPLLKEVGAVSPVHVYAEELIKSEIIQRGGLTPTDLLHVTGEFTPWDGEIARMAVERVSRNWLETPESFAARVKQVITRRIVAEIVEFLSDKKLSDAPLGVIHTSLDRWLYNESLAPQNPFLGSRIFLKVPIVGIGAPARAFLPPVAEALQSEIVFPPHFAVANAVGTVVGNVTIRREGQVFPCLEGMVTVGYDARADGAQRKFPDRERALDYTRTLLSERARTEAEAAGAQDVQVTLDEQEWLDGTIRLTAWAVGRPQVR